MITNLEFRDMYNVGVNSNGKFKINDNVLSISDIPFVMFHFDSYGDEQLEFIKSNMEKFNYSTALIKVHAECTNPEELDNLKIEFENSAVLLYVNITDEDNTENGLRQSVLDLINYVTSDGTADIDKLCLVDKTTTLDMVGYDRIVDSISDAFDRAYDKFGICESPLSSGENSCLSAEFARELLSLYSDLDDGPLPSANHQKGNIAFDGTPLNIGCGCIQYIVINSDSEPPVNSVKKSSTNKKEKQNSEKKNKPKKSSGISFGKFI